jgi:hypothetical protein
MRRNSDKEPILFLFLEFEPSEQQGGKRLDDARRTLGDLLTLSNCKMEQVLRDGIRKELQRVDANGIASA